MEATTAERVNNLTPEEKVRRGSKTQTHTGTRRVSGEGHRGLESHGYSNFAQLCVPLQTYLCHLATPSY